MLLIIGDSWMTVLTWKRYLLRDALCLGYAEDMLSSGVCYAAWCIELPWSAQVSD